MIARLSQFVAESREALTAAATLLAYATAQGVLPDPWASRAAWLLGVLGVLGVHRAARKGPARDKAAPKFVNRQASDAGAAQIGALVAVGVTLAAVLTGSLAALALAVLVALVRGIFARPFIRPVPSPTRCMPAGTIGVARYGGFLPWLIRAVTRGPVNHAFIATGRGDVIVEGEPGGARLGKASEYRDVYWLTSLTEGMTPAQLECAVSWAMFHLGTPYSYLDDAAIALVDLFGWAPGFMRRRLASTKTLMCSQLCDAALAAAGRNLFDDRPAGAVSPSDLYRLNYHGRIGIEHPTDGTWSPLIGNSVIFRGTALG